MKSWKIALLTAGDMIVMYISLFGMLLISNTQNVWRGFMSHAIPFSIIFFFWVGIFFVFDQYDPIKGRPRIATLKRLGYAFTTCLLAGVIIFYIGSFGITPKMNLFLVMVFFAFLFVAWRRFIFKIFKNKFTTKVVFLDDNKYVDRLKKVIKSNPQLGYRLAKEGAEPDVVISQVPFSRGKKLLSLSGAYESILGKVPVDIAERTLPYQISSRQESILGLLTKRLFDILFSASMMIATIWLWPFIIGGIKITGKGPVFYVQKRMGQSNRPFSFIKFRSMRIDAEKNGAVWAEKEDTRITKFGRFLRKGHLDELPQMINIFMGDMSVVGPRPERPEFVGDLEKEIPLYTLRHIIKPGITGWAQIKFRYARTVLESKEKFEYDLYYIKNRSMILDIGIIIKTLQVFIKRT